MGIVAVIFSLFVSGAYAGDQGTKLDRLAAIAMVVRAELDGAHICPELQNLSASDRTGLPQRLEGEIRTELNLLTAAERSAFFGDAARVAACRVRCRCGTYADWIGESAEGDLAALRSRLLERERSARPSAADYVKCARANREWACRHPVLRRLLKEIPR